MSSIFDESDTNTHILQIVNIIIVQMWELIYYMAVSILVVGNNIYIVMTFI